MSILLTLGIIRLITISSKVVSLEGINDNLGSKKTFKELVKNVTIKVKNQLRYSTNFSLVLDEHSLLYNYIIHPFDTILDKLVLLLIKFEGCLHEISFRVKRNIFNLVSGQSLITVYMKYSELKLIANVISLRLL